MRKLSLAFAAAALALAATPALAHHSFAMYDQHSEVSLSGTVTEFQWTNPHSWIEMQVMGPDGKDAHYSLETGSVHTLSNIGWKSKYIHVGDKITVTINPMKDGTHGGAIQSIVFADGRKIIGGGR